MVFSVQKKIFAPSFFVLDFFFFLFTEITHMIMCNCGKTKKNDINCNKSKLSPQNSILKFQWGGCNFSEI